MRPWVLGLTGGIGSGKSAAARYFAGFGVTVVDSDEVSRWVVAPGQPALADIVARFGEGILDSEGQLDRPALRRRVFEHPDDRRWLEALLHPLVRSEVDLRLARAPSPYAVLMSPLLVETGRYRDVRRLLVVDTPEALQLERAVGRDGVDEAQIRSIMAAQAQRDARLRVADDVLLNDQGLAHLEGEVRRLHEFYLSLREPEA